MGADYMTRLWNLGPKTNEQFKEADYFEPGLEFFVIVLEQADPASQVEDALKQVRDANFQWRALRILRRHCSAFINPNNAYNDVGRYLEEIITQKLRDRIVGVAKEHGTEMRAGSFEAPSSSNPSPAALASLLSPPAADIGTSLDSTEARSMTSPTEGERMVGTGRSVKAPE